MHKKKYIKKIKLGILPKQKGKYFVHIAL